VNSALSPSRSRAPRLVAAALGLLALVATARAEAQDEVVPPSVLTSSDPVYPSNQVASGKDVLVVLAVTVDAEGHVAAATVLESGGVDFDRAAIDAAHTRRPCVQAHRTRRPGSGGGQTVAQTRVYFSRGLASSRPRAGNPSTTIRRIVDTPSRSRPMTRAP